MQDDPFDFAGMLCARLCHDLVGPVGALGNGLELLALDQDPAMRQQTLALMASSVGAVAAKLQFFRLAFGTGGDMAQRLPITALQTAINDFYALRPHIQIKWVTEGGGSAASHGPDFGSLCNAGRRCAAAWRRS